MKKTELNILLLEDDDLDAEIIKTQLNSLEEYNCIIQWVTNKQTYLKVLQSGFPDIVLSDYKIPQYSGMNALKDLRSWDTLIPFIFVTGAINEETAAETIKSGAWDYVIKDRLFRLPLAIKSALLLKEERMHALVFEAKNRQLSMAIEQCPVHIVISNTENIIEYVNAKFTEVTGYLSEEVVGKESSMLIQENYKKEYNDLFIKGFKKKQGEIQSIKKDGSLFWEYISISPLKNEKGKVTHFIEVKEDITQRKEIEQALFKALDRAEQSDKLKENFLQSLSHEIRTPLNAIVGFSELLSNNKEVALEKINEYVSIIRNSSDQLLSIVSNVLTAASIQTGQEILNLKPVNLNKILNYIFEIYYPMAARKNLALLFPNKTDDNQDYIVTDEVKLIQILENLLNNAIKFTHAGCIELKYIIVDNSIKILVKDTGIGIHNESTEIIFERFRQADPSISVNYGGTGLGLSISKSYAQMLNGTLQVESQPGIGSEFMLTLPYISNNSIIEKEECTRKTLIAKSLKILVAEDEITNYHLLKDFLQSNNTTLYYAQNGFEAVKSVKDNPQIDLVLMDIKMPVMDGITALKKIKKIRKQLPVIALTAYAMMQDGQKFLNLGFDDYIPKPIHRDNLIEKINNLISIP